MLVLEQVTDSGVSVALDVLRAANALTRRAGLREPFVVEVLSKRGRAVTTGAGLRLGVHGAWKRASRCDVLLVPGCWVETAEEVEALLEREDVKACGLVLQQAARRGAVLGTSCRRVRDGGGRPARWASRDDDVVVGLRAAPEISPSSTSTSRRAW